MREQIGLAGLVVKDGIFERALLTTMMSFKPSPSRSATCSWLI